MIKHLKICKDRTYEEICTFIGRVVMGFGSPKQDKFKKEI